MRTESEYLALVNRSLCPMLESLGEIPQILREAMEYSLQAGGKRLRPVLLLAAAELAGTPAEQALPWACGLEMIHTYSLIHDDLPCMDNDDLRRGRPTSHKVFGEGMATLAGDGLLHGAMELMLRHAAECPDLRGTRAALAIARRSGVTGMVAGQVMDVTGEGTEPTGDKVRYIHLHKTADLLTAPMEAGLLLGGADEALLQAGVAYGQHLGLAFQIVDDLLDVTGDAALMGKRTGMDAQEGKLTWIAVRGVEGAREDAREQIALARESILRVGTDVSFFTELADRTRDRVC